MSNIDSILQESIGIEREVIVLISRILLIFQRYIYTSYGISKCFYRGIKEKQGGMGQEYVLLVNISRDSSCIIIKEVQNNNNIVVIISSITKQSMNELAVVFVDNMNFL